MLGGVGDLANDTAVERLDGGDDAGHARYTSRLSPEWEIWGPMGGYVASLALRAAGAESPFARPASFFCHYLAVAAFDTVDLEVDVLRQARTALAQRVRITQGGRPILEATVWSVGEVDGLEHDASGELRPDVPPPDEVPDLVDLLSDEEREQRPPFPFWGNLDSKPLQFSRDAPPAGSDPVWRQWLRFSPTPMFEDPWVDACRSVILLDLQSWPSAGRFHGYGGGYIAPSLDLYVAFHDLRPGSAWLLADGHSPVARDGLMAWHGRLWSDDLSLVATGTGQLLCRRVPAPPPA